MMNKSYFNKIYVVLVLSFTYMAFDIFMKVRKFRGHSTNILKVIAEKPTGVGFFARGRGSIPNRLHNFQCLKNKLKAINLHHCCTFIQIKFVCNRLQYNFSAENI